MREKFKVAIVMILNQEKKILVVRRSQVSNRSGEWESPAGHLEDGESPETAALREVYEETGLEVLLYPKSLTIDLRDGGKGIIFLGKLPGKEDTTKLDPKEHDKSHWVSLSNIDKVKPAPPDFAKNIKKILQMNGVPETQLMKTKKTQRKANLPLRHVRVLPNAKGDLKEAILVGDEVDIFLKNQIGKKKGKPEFHGIVERRNRNVIWLRDPDSLEMVPLDWDDSSTWAFVRVVRGDGDVINYVNGNPFDPDDKAVQRAKGLGLILDPPKPKHTESVLRIMRGETPDMDNFSLGQAPKTLDVVAPNSFTAQPLYHQVREALGENFLEPDLVDDVGNGSVMILTQDPDMKKEIREVLRKKGKKITETRTGALLISSKRKGYANTGVAPVPGVGAMNPQQITKPQMQMVMPDPQDTVNQLEKASGSPAQKGPNGLTVTFDDPSKMAPFMNTASRRGHQRKTVVGSLAVGVRRAFQNENFSQAASCLNSLRNLGVREATLIKANLATRSQWENLRSYLEGKGDIRTARVAQNLASSGRVE